MTPPRLYRAKPGNSARVDDNNSLKCNHLLKYTLFNENVRNMQKYAIILCKTVKHRALVITFYVFETLLQLSEKFHHRHRRLTCRWCFWFYFHYQTMSQAAKRRKSNKTRTSSYVEKNYACAWGSWKSEGCTGTRGKDVKFKITFPALLCTRGKINKSTSRCLFFAAPGIQTHSVDKT